MAHIFVCIFLIIFVVIYVYIPTNQTIVRNNSCQCIIYKSYLKFCSSWFLHKLKKELEFSICAYIYFVLIIKEQKIETHTFMDKIWLYCNKIFSSVGFIPLYHNTPIDKDFIMVNVPANNCTYMASTNWICPYTAIGISAFSVLQHHIQVFSKSHYDNLNNSNSYSLFSIISTTND